MRKDLFTEALNHASQEGTMLVYNLPSKSQPLAAQFDLPEGMFLAQVGDHVRVLGVNQESRAYSGGMRAGDEIRSFNGGAPVTTLEDFVRDYIATKHQAKVSGQTSYSVEVWRPSEGQVLAIPIATPPSIPSFF